MPDIHLNWVAIIIAAIVGFAIGGIWYAPPVLGNRWLALLGKTREDLGAQGLPTALQGVMNLVEAIGLGVLVSWTGANSFTKGAELGVVVWVAFVATAWGSGAIAEKRSFALWAINAVYPLIMFAVMGAIIAHWR